MQKRLRVGIVGSGRIAWSHVPGIRLRVPEAEVVMLAARNAQTGHALADPLGIPVVSDYQDLLEDDSIDAVFILTSTDTHAEFSIRAARAGKHIFCEKPIDRDARRIKEVIEAVEAAGVKYQVGYNRRFDRHFLRVRERVQQGAVGDVHLIKVCSRDPVAPDIRFVKTSGGMYADMFIHDFDMVQFLSGAKVTEVSAFGANRIDPRIGALGDVDTAAIMLRLDSGALAAVDGSRRAVYGYDQRVEVFGSRGCVSAANVGEHTALHATENGVAHAKPLWNFLERYADAYVEQARQFVLACLHDTPTPLGVRDGLYPVLIADAAQRSSDLGGMPVRVKQYDEL